MFAEDSPPPPGGEHVMDPHEVRAYLSAHRWGVLAMLHQGRPYAVPVSFGSDGTHLYVASGPGRKLASLRACPSVCLTVADVENGDRWSSVVVLAEAAPVEGLREKLHGLNVIRLQQPNGGPPSAKDLARAATATVFRLTPVEISGRSRR